MGVEFSNFHIFQQDVPSITESVVKGFQGAPKVGLSKKFVVTVKSELVQYIKLFVYLLCCIDNVRRSDSCFI